MDGNSINKYTKVDKVHNYPTIDNTREAEDLINNHNHLLQRSQMFRNCLSKTNNYDGVFNNKQSNSYTLNDRHCSK